MIPEFPNRPAPGPSPTICPASRPTPGDVCRAEADRLNQLGLGDADGLTLVETRVDRTDSAIRIVHLFEYGPHRARLLTEPFEGYGGDEEAEADET